MSIFKRKTRAITYGADEKGGYRQIREYEDGKLKKVKVKRVKGNKKRR